MSKQRNQNSKLQHTNNSAMLRQALEGDPGQQDPEAVGEASF